MTSMVPTVSFSSLYGLASASLGRPSTPLTSSTTTRMEHEIGSNSISASGTTTPLTNTTSSPPDTQPTPRGNTTTTLHQQATVRHHHHHLQQQTGYLPLPVSEAELQLSSECPHCQNEVVVKVPRYILTAMQGTGQQQLQHQQQQVYALPSEKDRREEWREGVVGGAVKCARAFRDSRFPPMIFAFLRLILAFILYLDERFSLHQRLLVVFWAVLEDLVRIEKEVGLLRNSGEAISVMWEATVKGIIALAKSSESQQQQQQHTQHSSSGSSNHQQYPSQPFYAPHASPSYPFPSSTASSYDPTQTYPHSYPSSPPLRPHRYSSPPHHTHHHLQPPFQSYPSSSGTSGEDDSLSESETLHLRPTSHERPRTLRRTAYSTPSFHEQMEAGGANGANGGGGGGGRSRPTVPRQRSRSGPEDAGGDVVGSKRGTTGDSWAGRVVKGVVGRLPGQ